jgi:hypothetical protein
MDNEEFLSENLKTSKAENILPGWFILNGVNKLFFLLFLRGFWGIASSLTIPCSGQGKNRIHCDCESLVLLLQYIAWCTMRVACISAIIHCLMHNITLFRKKIWYWSDFSRKIIFMDRSKETCNALKMKARNIIKLLPALKKWVLCDFLSLLGFFQPLFRSLWSSSIRTRTRLPLILHI